MLTCAPVLLLLLLLLHVLLFTRYGLEMACPQSPIPFVFNATTKACSVPTTGSNASKTPAPAAAPVAPKASPKPAVPKASPQPAVAATVSRVSSGKMLA
jgi:hypothetical protein